MDNTAKVRVLIADDHALVRAGIASLLRALKDVEVVGEAEDGAEAVAIASRLRPDVVVLDITMKGMGGLEAAERIALEFPRVKVIMLSMHTDKAFVAQALNAGAAAYLIKDAAAVELELALRSVMRGEKYLSPAVSTQVVDGFVRQNAGRSGDPALTPRQAEVLKLMAAGKGTKEIAFALGLSVKTVESHRAQIQERLGIRDLAGLIRYAMRTGLTPPEG